MVQWHWIHGSCFPQCFMLTATAALQMRVNIAGEPSTLGRALSHGLNVKLLPAGWHRLKGRTVWFFFPPSLLFCPLFLVDVSFCLIGSFPHNWTRVKSVFSMGKPMHFQVLMKNKWETQRRLSTCSQENHMLPLGIPLECIYMDSSHYLKVSSANFNKGFGMSNK